MDSFSIFWPFLFFVRKKEEFDVGEIEVLQECARKEEMVILKMPSVTTVVKRVTLPVHAK